MKNIMGRMVLLVKDYEETLAFYKEVLGFHTLFDATSESGKRYLHMAPSEKEGMGIWFLKAQSEEQEKAIGKQTQGHPTMVLYTDSFEEMYQRLLKHKVTIRKEPETARDSRFLHFLDLYGNEIVLVQMQ